MNPIPYSGKITFQVFARSQMLHWGWKKYLIALVPFLIVVSYLLNLKPPFTVESLLPPFAGFLVIPFVLFTTRSTWKKVYNNTPSLQHEFTGEIDTSSLKTTSIHGAVTLPWSEFIKATVTKDLVLIYQGPIQFHILTPEMFATPEGWRSACDVISQCVRKRS